MCFWGGWKQEADWNSPVRRRCGFGWHLLVWTESRVHPAHRFAIVRGKQGSLWDSVGLGYFFQLGLFLYGYPQ